MIEREPHPSAVEKPTVGPVITLPVEPRTEKAARRRVLGSDAIGLLGVFVQVALITAIMVVGGLETSGMRRIVAFASIAFVVHHFLPLRFRLRFFALISFAGLVIVLGGVPGKRFPDLTLGLPRALAIFAIGAGLIALCHLRIGFWKRAGLLALAGVGLAAFRAGVVESGRFAILWPVLAAMFMFRIVVYLYELSTTPQRPDASRSFAYFFVLPNSCALLFPVIDFRTFCRRYYDEPALRIYSRGAKWMRRGIVQLLLYHYVNLTWSITAEEVTQGADLIRYVATNSFHYVKISGQFHLLIGLLLLFGFNLPETNHRYFLASSFTDYWRRVNIYWREFMMRVFYYPAFFRLKKLGQTPALALATLWTFFVTWALHLYQTWWVTGAVSATWTDSLFWTALALLVLGSALWELKRGRTRKLAASTFTAREALAVMLRTAATFSVISVLWSLWSAPSLAQWLRIWSMADGDTVRGAAAVLGVLMAATLLFEIAPVWKRGRDASPRGDYASPAASAWRIWGSVAGLLLLLGGLQGLLRLPREALAAAPLADARSVLNILRRQNPPGEARGYYERLTSVDLGNRQYWEALQLRVFPFHYEGESPVRKITEFPFIEPLPNVRTHAYDTEYWTNRWGLRYRDCETVRPPGVLRLAVLGSSHVMGWGVPAEAMFSSLLERRLNQNRVAAQAFEVLNFAVAGYGPMGQIQVVRKRVAPFHPQVVLHVAHLNDFDWVNRDATKTLRPGVISPDPKAAAILSLARVDARTNSLMATERLRRHEHELLRSSYEEMVRSSRAFGAIPVCVLMPLPRGEPPGRGLRDQLLNIARGAGFIVVDLSHCYAGIPAEKLEIDEPGRHSNAAAHALIANELHRQLTEVVRDAVFPQLSGPAHAALPNPNP